MKVFNGGDCIKCAKKNNFHCWECCEKVFNIKDMECYNCRYKIGCLTTKGGGTKSEHQ